MKLRVPLPAKLMLSYLVVTALITLPAFFALRSSLLGTLERSEQRDLLARAQVVADQLRGLAPTLVTARIHELARVLDARITVIAGNGVVTADSMLDTLAHVDNHAARLEVVRAKQFGEGVDVRLSATLGVELVYVAVPLDPKQRAGTIVRIATQRAQVVETASNAILALRVGIGIGVSAAVLLSLIAALYIARPLRRLRDVARAFAVADWVEVKPKRSNDELGELTDALDKLGGQLRQQLVAVGAAESLVLQSVEALASPAALLDDSLGALAVNGALRTRAALTPDIEEVVLRELRDELAGAIAGTGAVETVPLRALTRGTIADGERFHVSPLARPAAKPLWLIVLERDARELAGEVRKAADAVAEAERRVETNDPGLAELRYAVDHLVATTAHDVGPPLSVNLAESIKRALAELRDAAIDPPAEIPDLMIVDHNGLVVRALRLFLGIAHRGARTRRLAIAVAVDGGRVELRIAGVAADVSPLAVYGRLLGTNAGTESATNREAMWLSLRRA